MPDTGPPETLAPSARRQDARRGLERRVLRFVQEAHILRPGERVLVAVSGGPDSTALLLILSALARRLGLHLSAAYFDHGLRGAEVSKGERDFVARLAGGIGLPLRAGGDDVRSHARRERLSLEQAAREMRYRFLAQAAREGGCGVVAAGHTADDQVETVLMHLIRGSGLEGMAGMAARREWALPSPDPAPVLARPLLCLTRGHTEAYCRAAGLSPLEDESNRSAAFLRSRLRRELLPLLRQYNPRLDRAVLRLAEAARHDLDLLDRLAEEALALDGPASEGRVVLPRRRLADLPEALQRHAARLALRCLLGDLREVAASHVEAVVGALGRPAGYHLDLPRGVRLDAGYGDIVVSTRAPERPQVPAEMPLPTSGRLQWGPWSLEVEVGPAAGAASRDPRRAWLDADGVGGPLAVRSRRPGDRFQPLGMAEDKKLQDFLVDARVPRAERDLLPLLCSPRGIAWVGGVRVAQWARVVPATRRVLKVSLRRSGGTP